MLAFLKRHRVALAWFGLLTLVMMLPVLVGRAYYPADIRFSHPLWYDGQNTTRNYDLIDTISLFYPNDRFFSEGIKQGHIRSWNPYVLCGHPFLAAGGAGVLYPPRLLGWTVFSPVTVHHLILATHLFLAGFAFSLFLKRLKLPEIPSLLGGTIWAFNGFTMTWFESEFSVVYAAVTAVVLERLTTAFDNDTLNPGPAWTASVLMGLVSWAAHAQFWVNSMLLFGVWVLYLCLRRRAWKSLLFAVPVMLIPLGIATLMLAPTLELASRTVRPDRDFWLVTGAFRNIALSLPLTMLAPDLLGQPVEGLSLKFASPVGDWLMLESCAYISALGLLLALASWSARHQTHWKFFAILAIGLILVPATPAYFPFFKLIPGFTKVNSTRFLFQFVLCLAVLASWGLQALTDGPVRRSQRLGQVLAVVCGALLLFGLAMSSSAPQSWLNRADWLIQHRMIAFPFESWSPGPSEFRLEVAQTLRRFYSLSSPVLWLPILWSGLGAALMLSSNEKNRSRTARGIVLLVAADLLVFGMRFNTTCRPAELHEEPTAISYVKEHLGNYRVLELGTIRPNTGMLFDLPTFGGQDALLSSRLVNFLVASQRVEPDSQDRSFGQIVFPLTSARSHLVNIAGGKFVLTYPSMDLTQLGFRQVFQQVPQGMVVWENPHAFPLVRMAPLSISAKDPAHALQLTQEKGHDPRTVVVESPARQGHVTTPPIVEAQRPGYWKLKASGSGWLVLAETWDPGWKATVNGQPADIVVAESTFQAVWLEDGNHIVEWTYSPPFLKKSLTASGVSLLLALLGMFWSRFFKPQQKKSMKKP